MYTFRVGAILLGALLSLLATSLAAQSGQCSVAFSLNPPSPVPCGQSVTINATLQGIDSGTVAVSLDHQMFCGGSSSCSATASGLAAAVRYPPVACFSPGSLAFGQVTVGTRSGPQEVTLTNCGKGPMTIGGVTTSGDFAQTNNCGSSLGAGASCAINITFTPTTTGARVGMLIVSDDAAGSPHTAALSGTGAVPPPPPPPPPPCHGRNCPPQG